MWNVHGCYVFVLDPLFRQIRELEEEQITLGAQARSLESETAKVGYPTHQH